MSAKVEVKSTTPERVRRTRGALPQFRGRLTQSRLLPKVEALVRGRRQTIAAVIAQALGRREEAQGTALAAAFAEACGPRLAREVSCRGALQDGRLLVLARTAAWAAQVEALAPQLCERVNARLWRPAAAGLEVRVAPER